MQKSNNVKQIVCFKKLFKIAKSFISAKYVRTYSFLYSTNSTYGVFTLVQIRKSHILNTSEKKIESSEFYFKLEVVLRVLQFLFPIKFRDNLNQYVKFPTIMDIFLRFFPTFLWSSATVRWLTGWLTAGEARSKTRVLKTNLSHGQSLPAPRLVTSVVLQQCILRYPAARTVGIGCCW